MTVLSGTVTSSIITALSLQAPVLGVPDDSVPLGVAGVVVAEPSGAAVSGVAVSRDKPGRVGGRVEVTKRGGASVVGPGATLIQEARLRLVSTMQIQIFFIR